MKNIYLLWLLMGLCFSAFSQKLTVKNAESGEPVEGATIISDSPQAFAATNSKGQADISGFKGSENIVIQHLGYKTESRSYSGLEKISFELELTPTSVSLEDVIISATKWHQTSADVPSKVISILPKEIALQNPQTAADLLSSSGKVFIQKSQQGGGSPMIRGFATNRLLYSIDGVRMNTAIFRGGNLQNVISLDPFAIENTEVFFGPGSVIYGSDAIGGVMSFQTLVPLLSETAQPLILGNAVTRYSSANNEKTAHFHLSTGFSKWAFTTSFSTNNFGDLKMGSYGPDEYLRPFYVQRFDSTDVVVTNDDPRVQRPTGYSQINMMEKIRFKPNEKWDIQYGFHYSETSDYSRYDRHIRYKNGLPKYGEWSYGPQKWMMNNLNISYTDTSRIFDEISLRLARQFFEESRISRDINKPLRETRIEKVDAYSVNIDFVKSAGKKNKLFYGLESIWNIVESTGTDKNISTGVEMKGPSRYPQALWSSYGIYLTDQFRVSEKFLVQAGARYNQFAMDAEFDTTFYPFPFTKATLNKSAVTGSFGIVFRPAKKWMISSNFATGFRSPNVDDIGKVFDSEPGSVTVPNPDLKAEYVYNADLDIARIFGEHVKVDLTGYYSILRNALVRRDFSLNGQDSIIYGGEMSKVQAVQNAAAANVYGLQAGIEIKLPGGFGLISDFNYQVGEEELDDGSESPSRHAPPWYGTTRITFSANRLNMQFYSVYSGEKKFRDLPEEEKGKTEIYAIDKNGDPWSPGWYTLNFKAIYSFTEKMSVSAGLENITDQRYRPYSSGLAAPGRNVILSLRCKF